jgi:DASS family divalent anion:Na+ symporter
MQTVISPFHWVTALTAISLLYFYSHYGFASMTAHISSMYSAFALLAITAGAPPMLTAFLLAFLSSLCASITHYGTGTAPVYFGSDYISIKDWWGLGALVSVVNIVIWVVVGALWWKLIGLW